MATLSGESGCEDDYTPAADEDELGALK